MPIALTVDNVSKKFLVRENRPRSVRESLTWLVTRGVPRIKTFWALRDVSFSVEQGTTYGIIGHNGAGKSTLLKLLCGLGRPTSGRIHSTGVVSGVLELGGGFNPNLTGRQNLRTAGLLNGLTLAQVKAREERIIAFAELDKFIDQETRTYSSGMYLRLAFAAAMEFEPSLLVMDEVLSVGDERFQQKCIARIAELKKSGTTLIFTSHVADQISSLCDKVLLLDHGRVVLEGEPARALDSYHELLRIRTAERAASIASLVNRSPAAAREDGRQGTHEATIESVEVRDAAGQPVGEIGVGAGMRVRIGYRLARPIDDLALVIGIYDESNHKCFETSVGSMAATFGALTAEGAVTFTIKSLPLLPGKYYLNLGLFPLDWSFMYDHHWRMHAFRVTGPEQWRGERSGVVALDIGWGSTAERAA